MTCCQSVILAVHEHVYRAFLERVTGGAYARGFFREPTIFADVEPSTRIAQEEIFGPVVSVMRCRSLDEAIAIGNNGPYSLSASIYTQT